MAHGGHSDTHGEHGHEAHAEHPAATVAVYSPSEEARKRWWSMPFDTTTNFSLLGFFLGWIMDRNNKKVDLHLK